MADSIIDWTDETLRPLDELALLAFPDGGVTADTLKRRARQGKLAVYRPGKAYLASLSGVRLMIEKTRVLSAQERPPCPTPIVPNYLGLTKMDISNMALDEALKPKLTPPAKKAERPSDEERARVVLAHRLEIEERRRVPARKRYREKKAERSKDAPNRK